VAVQLPVEAAGLTRASVGSFGELDVRTLLAVVGAPAVDATGSGWAGGRSAIYRDDVSEAAVVALAWDTARDAEQWAASVPIYLARAFGSWTILASPCAATSCWQVGERSVAFHRSGPRTSLAIAAGVDQAASVARASLDQP
jgi:hypothetical protein